MFYFYFLLILLLSGNSIFAAAPSPTQTYANKKVLVEPDVYTLYWNYTDVDILFEVHVKATGWISFGISPNGDMSNSDIIVTWANANNGSVHFSALCLG
jgi:hypothetical protein